MRKHLSLSRVLTYIFIGLFIWYGYNNRESFQNLKEVTLLTILIIAVGKLLVFVINGFFTKWTAEQFIKKLKLSESVYLAVLSALGNYFGPLLGGTSIRAVYLKKAYKLTYSNFTSTIAGYYLIIFIANSILALISLYFLPQSEKSTQLFVFFGIWLAALVMLTFIRLPKKEKFSKLLGFKPAKYFITAVYDIEKSWHILVKNRKLMFRLMLLGFSSFFITFVLTYVEFKAINIDIGLAALGLYTAVSTMSLLLSLTPGAIGIREILLIFVSSTLGVGNEHIIQVAVIDRSVTFLVLLCLFIMIRTPLIRKKIALADAPI